MKQQRIIVILGATAVGKTEIAIDLAQNINGEIISADSMLVYKGMDIGTAKPSKQELQKIKHYLIDIVNPDCNYNVSDFIFDAETAIKTVLEKGKVPIICGGTNYYVYSLLEGLCEGPESDPAIRKKLECILKEKGNDYLHDLLKKIDPLSAGKIHKNNTKRVIRAIEVYEITGILHSNMQRLGGIENKYNIIKIGLSRDKEELFKRIEARVCHMFTQGLINEVKTLLEQGIKNSITASLGVGYRETIEYLFKSSDIAGLRDEIIKNTRKLVKKQLTWLKKDDKIKWFDLSNNNANIINQVLQVWNLT